MEEDEALEWENNEVEENGGNMSWILNKGWAVGKKMLITGVVISSAPVILPPLVVISTLGLVCAVPFGFFLASYTCAEKLVTTLVPSHEASPVTYEELRAKEDYEEDGGDADMERHGVDRRVEQDGRENYEGGIKTVETNGRKPTETEEEYENGNVKEEVTVDVGVELCERDDSEPVKETTAGLVEKIRDEGVSRVGMKNKEEESAESEAEQERERSGGNTNGTKANQNPQTVTGSGNGTKANNGKKKRKAKKVEESGIDDNKQKAGLRSATPAGNKEADIQVTVPANATSPGGGASKEAVYSEDDVWKQIDAVRAIIGYTTARHSTCIEELKALYVFTGVQPPNDPCHLQELNDKLKFLMSIVGIK